MTTAAEQDVMDAVGTDGTGTTQQQQRPQGQQTQQQQRPQGQRQVATRMVRGESTTRYAVGFTAIIAGFGLWVIGARYTIDGVIWACNGLISFVGVQYAITTTWHWYAILSFIPCIFSKVELRNWRSILRAGWIAVVVWATIVAVDMFTTFLGCGVVQPDAPELVQWFASNYWARGTAAFFLTFLPEMMMHAGIRLLGTELATTRARLRALLSYS